MSVEDDVVSVSKRITPLPESIEGSKGSVVEVGADEISAAADKYLRDSAISEQNNQRPLLAATELSGTRPIPVTISQDGNRVFAGQLTYQKSAISSPGSSGLNGRRDTFEMTGDGFLLWPLLEDISLRDLDLGTIQWSKAACEESWISTVEDGWKAIYAPVVYGPSSFDEGSRVKRGRFDFQDLRPQLYFYYIVKAIFDKAGSNLESTFFETQAFKECVHTFGVGEAMEFISNRVIGLSNAFTELTAYQQINFDTGTLIEGLGEASTEDSTFTALVSGAFQVRIEAGFDGPASAIVVNVNGLNTQTINLEGLNTLDVTLPITLSAGSVVKFFIAADEAIEGQPELDTAFLTSFQSSFSLLSDEESFTVTLSSCLPDKPVKEFLRGISHLFNLEWSVDSILRKTICEPRFPYQIDNVQYPGFYDITNLRGQIGRTQNSQINVNRVPGYQKSLEIGFKANYAGLADFFQNKQPDSNSIALNAVRFNDATDLPIGSKSESRNPYFQAMVVAAATYYAPGVVLPHLWKGQSNSNANPDRYDGFELDDPDYTYEPSCGIIQREGTAIIWESNGRDKTPVPLMMQRYPLASASTKLCLSYCDSGADPASASQSTAFLPGLGTTFYPHLAATLLKGRMVTLSALISNPIQVYIEKFRQAIALRYDDTCAYPSILVSVKGYKPGGIATMEYLALVMASSTDNALMQHYAFDPILIGEEQCNYSFQDTFTTNTGGNDGNVVEIRLRNGYLIPLSYPYRSNIASDASRLQNDLIRTLDTMGVTHGTVICTINISQQFSIVIADTNLQLANIFVQSMSELIATDFTKSNCS